VVVTKRIIGKNGGPEEEETGHKGSLTHTKTKNSMDPWDRCYDFLNIFAEKFRKRLAFLTQKKAKLCQNLIITLVSFEKKTIFRQKLAKIAENCDHNIGPLVSAYTQVITITVYTYLFSNLFGHQESI
jgi:hypothetical protein